MFYLCLIGLLVYYYVGGVIYLMREKKREEKMVQRFKEREDHLLKEEEKYFKYACRFLNDAKEKQYESWYLEWILVNYDELNGQIRDFKKIVGDFDGAIKNEELRKLFVRNMTSEYGPSQTQINDLNMYFDTEGWRA